MQSNAMQRNDTRIAKSKWILMLELCHFKGLNHGKEKNESPRLEILLYFL